MKKLMKNTVGLLLLLACTATTFVACNDYTGKYEMTDGTPTIYYVRPTIAESRDSLLTGALMGETVCIVGDNLTSIQEVWFNDKQAILNINFITNHTLVVAIPREMPGDQTDKIYFVNKAGTQTDFDFVVFMPTPVVNRIVCEFVPEGGDVVIEGDYFFDVDPENPVTLKVGSYEIEAADVTVNSANKITFKAPPVGVTGQISVTTMYGTGAKSKQIFRDERGLITNFDDGFVGGWERPNPTATEDNPGAVVSLLGNNPEYALEGKYAVMRSNGPLAPGEWVGGAIVNVWSSANPSFMTDPLFASDPETSILRFEAYVRDTWSAVPMSIFFAPTGSNEDCLWDKWDVTGPRGFWVPWAATGSYKGTGWETVSIPIADMKYNGAGVDLGAIPEDFGQLTIALHNRGHVAYGVGTACEPYILLDNIRVVPGE